MADPRLAREWLAKAGEDYCFAQVNLEEQKPFWAQICFHYHQAAEKYLKAYIVAHDLVFRKAHDLILLLQICAARDPTVETLRPACEYLTAYYVETRYPVHWPTDFSREAAIRASESAAQVKSWAEARIPHP
jgi:HEPN domain-containing protein